MFEQKNEDLLSLTDPSIPKRMLSLFISLWITWLECRKSRAWRHWRERKKLENIHHTHKKGSLYYTHIWTVFFSWQGEVLKCLSKCLHVSTWTWGSDRHGHRRSGWYCWCLNLATYLSADCSDLALVHAGLSHYICQRATGQILHHHP